MTGRTKLKHGDFTGLAGNYAKYRPAYAATVLSALLGIVGRAPSTIRCADVGAGTGIWTRMLAKRGIADLIAVEPNDDMRAEGSADPTAPAITWRKGSGEDTGLDDNSLDLLTMASSFHWVDFARGTQEFHRVLKPGGHFAALWNPRHIGDSPLLLEIEAEIERLGPGMKRMSSGKSEFVERMTAKLLSSPYFDDLTYIEGRHVEHFSQEQYLGVWNSVNDIRSQLGEAKFGQFMDFVARRIAGQRAIECTYLTRLWVVRKRGG